MLLVVFIFLSAFFSGVEIAFFSLSSAKVRTMAREDLSGAKMVEKLKSNPQRLLIVILIGNNLVNIFAASLATQAAINTFGSSGVGIATGIVTLLVLVFGEILPKTIAQMHAKTITRYTAGLLYIIGLILLPFVLIFESLSKYILKILPNKKDKHIISEEDLHSMVHIGVEEGSMEHHEKDFIERLFKFNDMIVRDVQTPIDKIIMLNGRAIIDQVSHFAVNSGYSRFPVYDGSKQNIIGIVHLKDIFRANQSDNRDKFVNNIALPPVFVKDSNKLDDIFRMLIRDATHYGIIKNEKGLTTGVITLEDLLEELVGEIYDRPLA